MAETAVSCNIEHHAVLFALLAKRAVELCGEDGKKAILHGMILYGKERGPADGAERPRPRGTTEHTDKPGVRGVETGL